MDEILSEEETKGIMNGVLLEQGLSQWYLAGMNVAISQKVRLHDECGWRSPKEIDQLVAEAANKALEVAEKGVVVEQARIEERRVIVDKFLELNGAVDTKTAAYNKFWDYVNELNRSVQKGK